MTDNVKQSPAARRIAEDIEAEDESGENHVSADERSRSPSVHRRPSKRQRPSSHLNNYGGFPAPWHLKYWGRLFHAIYPEKDTASRANHRYLSFRPHLDHKGRLQSLTEAQRNEVGGIEYRALKVLLWLLPAYAALWLLIVTLVMTTYVSTRSSTAALIRHAQPDEVNPAWWAVFASFSAYSNTGMNLLDANMIPLQRDYLVLIFTGAAILGGNTLYPVFLRLCIWLLSKAVREDSELHHSLSFLLQHPRRCYLLLFPSRNTWILFFVQIAITLTAWIFWILLDIGQPSVDPGLPGGQRAMDGLYQSLGLRSCGYYIIEMSDIAPALQFFYVIVMYISVYPVLMSLRQTNIYEERSLGQDDTTKFDLKSEQSASEPRSQLMVHIRKQLAHDIWWLLLAIFLVTIVEHQNLRLARPGFTIFSVIFEVVSAYGNIGLSLGVPSKDYSFSASWRVLSKLILVAVMLRGRHRILPMAVDRAVLIPGEGLMERLDREDPIVDSRTRKGMEARIREDEAGAQAEHSGGGQQDPERV